MNKEIREMFKLNVLLVFRGLKIQQDEQLPVRRTQKGIMEEVIKELKEEGLVEFNGDDYNITELGIEKLEEKDLDDSIKELTDE